MFHVDMQHRYTAPFGPKGSSPLDADLARRLLSVALSRGSTRVM